MVRGENLGENPEPPRTREFILTEVTKQETDPSSAPAAKQARSGPSLGLRIFVARPELSSLLAAVALLVTFMIIAPPMRSAAAFSTVLYDASSIGIMAIAVCLLMIGGEFDLSAGVAVVTSALVTSMVSYQLNLHLFVGAAVAVAVSLGIGFFNGLMFVKTRIHSFLVTLSMFFMLQGANLGITKLVTGEVATKNISEIGGFEALRIIFASSFQVGGFEIRITVVWWILLTFIAMWILERTRVGNWIFAVGGDSDSARAVGVPVDKVKIGLFMGVGLLAWFYGMHRVTAFTSVQAGEGVGNELIYIAAAVVGGTLLTGGFGSPVGAMIGAFIFAVVRQGIVFAGLDPNWYWFFLGLMLLLATVFNLYVRKFATQRKVT